MFDILGWITINILVPALAPVAVMLVWKPFRRGMDKATAEMVRFVTPVKDGQLCWAGVAFCASGLYEQFLAEEKGKMIPHHGLVELVLFVLLLFNSGIAAGGTIYPSELPRPPGVTIANFYQAFIASILLSGIAAIVFTVVHFRLE